MHNKNNYLSIWSSTKNIGSRGKGQQLHGLFFNWMTIVLMLIPLNIKEGDALCVITCDKKKKQSNFTQSWKGLVKYNKDHGTTTMSCHVSFEHFVVLTLYRVWCWFDATMVPVDHQWLKKGISQLQVPLLVSLPLEWYFTKKLTLLKNNYLKIWCFT